MKNQIILPLLLCTLIASCAYTPINSIDYKKHNLYSSQISGNQKYKEIAPISASTSGFLWDPCEKLVLRVLEDAKALAKSQNENANSFMDVKWTKGDQYTTIPTCKTAYGWGVFYLLPLFTPWIKSVEFQGTAIEITENQIIENKAVESSVTK